MEESIKKVKTEMISEVIKSLAADDLSLYYQDSNSIAQEIQDKVRSLKGEEYNYDYISDLSVDEILKLMNNRSSCC